MEPHPLPRYNNLPLASRSNSKIKLQNQLSRSLLLALHPQINRMTR